MPAVARHEILDYQTYTEQRAELRASALAAKDLRRYHVGRYLTFLFENHETVRYQVQEMMRVERIVREKDIEHELCTYNELLGGPGELGCTLMVEIDDERLRNEKLTAWLGLQEHLYLRLPGGENVRAAWDPRQVGDTRLSAVQYLKFDVGGQVPTAIGCDHEDITAESELTAAQQDALRADLAAT